MSPQIFNRYGITTVEVHNSQMAHTKQPQTRMSEQELNLFKLDYGIEDEELIQCNYAYFKFLIRLYNITQQVPFYYYNERRELTRYYSPEPPRIFTCLFNELGSCWSERIEELSVCFVISSNEDPSVYKEFRKVQNFYFVQEMIIEYANQHGSIYYYNYKYLYDGFNEIWSKGDWGVDLIYPLSLFLSLWEHKLGHDIYCTLYEGCAYTGQPQLYYRASRGLQFVLNGIRDDFTKLPY